MYTIATLYELQRRLGLNETDAATAADLGAALQNASHLIETLTQRRYCPYIESRNLHIDFDKPRELILPDDLLELISIQSDQRILDKSAVRRLPSRLDLPASVLVLDDEELFGGTVNVTGIWGWHDRWTQAWRDSGDTVRDNPLNAAATSISVTDAGAPRFQVGQLLRLDAEYLRLTSIDTANNQLTALRGVQGSAPANHAQGASIETFAAAPAIRDLCLRYAALLLNSVQPLEAEAPPLLRGLRRLTA